MITLIDYLNNIQEERRIKKFVDALIIHYQTRDLK